MTMLCSLQVVCTGLTNKHTCRQKASVISVSHVGTANRVMELDVKIEISCNIDVGKLCLRCLECVGIQLCALRLKKARSSQGVNSLHNELNTENPKPSLKL